MAKCFVCGKQIVNVYTFDGNIYGKECWKKYALPEIEKRRQQEEDERLKIWNEQCWILVQVLKAKNLNRIKNEFKKQMIPKLITQFENEGWISKKQYEMAKDWLNKKDLLIETDMMFELGYFEGREEKYYIEVADYATGKRKKEAMEMVKKFEEARKEEWRQRTTEKMKQYFNQAKDEMAVEGDLKKLLLKWFSLKINQLENMSFEEVDHLNLRKDYIGGLARGALSPKSGYGKRMIEMIKNDLAV